MKTTDYLTFIRTFRKLDEMRWALVEKKYKQGLTADEHETLDYLAGWTWVHRVHVRGNHEHGNHKLEGAPIPRNSVHLRPVREEAVGRGELAQG